MLAGRCCSEFSNDKLHAKLKKSLAPTKAEGPKTPILTGHAGCKMFAIEDVRMYA
jgi:hypothetical protein